MAKKKPQQAEAKEIKQEKPAEIPCGLKIAVVILAMVGLILIAEGIRGLLVFSTTPPEMLYELMGAQQGAVPEGVPGPEELVQMLFMALVLFLFIGALYLVIAHFLRKKNKIARYVATIMCVIGLLFFSVGTILHAFIIYFLWLDKETKAAFA